MVDANQKWDVHEAIERMKPLAPYNIHWIEEPTSPDDVQGHATIAKVLTTKLITTLLCCTIEQRC